MRRHLLGLLGVVALIGAALAPCAQAGPLIGNATTVIKHVKGRSDAELRVLVINDDVFQDEEISTGPQSATKLLFKDNTSLTMGEGSKLKLTKVVFDPDPAKSVVALKATQGVFRMSTGRLPSAAYRIDTPVATIGVRGTVIEFSVDANGTTTLYVASGAAFVTVDRPNGTSDRVFVPLGQATVVSIGPDGLPLAPTPPGEPSSAFVENVRNMTMLVQLAGVLNEVAPGAGSAGGPGLVALQVTLTGDSALGGIAPGAGPGTGAGAALSSFGLTRLNPSGAVPPAAPPPLAPSLAPVVFVPLVLPPSPAVVNGPPPLTVPGPPTVTIAAPPPTPVRIGPASSVPVVVSSSGQVNGSLGGGLCGGSGISLPPSGGSVTFTCTISATQHGLQTIDLPFDLSNPDAEGNLQLGVIGVGPELAMDLPISGIDFGTVAPGEEKNFVFHIGNLTPDDALLPLDLIGLTILGIELDGMDAQYYSVVCVFEGQEVAGCHQVLGKNDILDIVLTFHAPQFAGHYDDAVLRLITDQFALFGEQGLTPELGLSAATTEVAEPGSLAVAGLLGGAAWLMARRRRR